MTDSIASKRTHYPKAAEGLVHSPLDGGSAVYQPSADRVHYLNHTGAVIMELCNGEHSVQEIAEFLQSAFALAAPPEAEVRDLLDDMTTMGLVIWTGEPRLGELSHKSVPSFLRALGAVEASLGKRRSEAAKIVWHTDVLPDALMPGVFALATHYVSLSHGEGWDLPMLQAGAMGRRLIAPRHSAYRDNLDDDCARFVPARPVPAMRELGEAERCILAIHPWSSEHFGHAGWWQPDEEAAAALLREAIDHPGRPWPTAPERFQRKTWEASTARLLEIVDG